MAPRKTATTEPVEVVEDKNVNPRKKAFDEALKQINKEIKSDMGQVIAKLGERPMEVKTIPTGSTVLDSICGGGYPVGRLIEIYGKESSGKTTMALIAAAEVQRNGGNVVYVDLENALDPRYARTLGVNTDELAVSQPDYAEQALSIVGKMAASHTVDLIVLDSIASLVPKAELEGDLEQQTIGLVARLMSRALKQLATVANRTGTTIIFINQTRDQIGGFSPMGTPETTPGGKAMKFYASMRIQVSKGKPIVEGKNTIGIPMKLKIVKNKIAPPFRTGESVLTYGKGINRAAEMIEIGPQFGVVSKTSPGSPVLYEAETNEQLGTSKDKSIKFLETHPEVLDRMTVALRKAMADKLDEIDTVEPEEDEVTEADLEAEELELAASAAAVQLTKKFAGPEDDIPMDMTMEDLA